MKVNFDISDNYALNFEGRHIDLHNNFEFTGIDYNVEEREINLYFKKSNGDWVNEKELSSLVLIHKSVTFLKITEQSEKSTYEDECCLGEITFFPSAEREINDRIISQSKPNEGDDIIYMFESEQRIRIHCDQIELKIND